MSNVTKNSLGPDLLEQARLISSTYQYVVNANGKGGFLGNASELPYVLAKGRTAQECLEAIQNEVMQVVAMILKEGQTPPASGNYRRTAQINVRVLPEEKLEFETVARKEGFRSVSDFLRRLAIEYGRRAK